MALQNKGFKDVVGRYGHDAKTQNKANKARRPLDRVVLS